MNRHITLHTSLFRLLSILAIVLTVSACHQLPKFSKKELACAKNISGLLNGASISLSRSIAPTGNDKKLLNLTIAVDNFKYDNTKEKLYHLMAGSIPAYYFYKNGMDSASNYATIDVVVKTTNDAYKNSYTIAQLKAVDSSLRSISSCIKGLETINIDTLKAGMDTALLGQVHPDSIIAKLRDFDQKYGVVKDIKFSGFQFDAQGDKEYIYSCFAMDRSASYQLVELWTNPDTKKVAVLNF